MRGARMLSANAEGALFRDTGGIAVAASMVAAIMESVVGQQPSSEVALGVGVAELWKHFASYGCDGEGVGDICPALSRSFAMFAVACCSRSASFWRFGFGVGVGLALAASSEREQPPTTRPQETEIVMRRIFIWKSQRHLRADVSTATARARNQQPGRKQRTDIEKQATRPAQA